MKAYHITGYTFAADEHKPEAIEAWAGRRSCASTACSHTRSSAQRRRYQASTSASSRIAPKACWSCWRPSAALSAWTSARSTRATSPRSPSPSSTRPATAGVRVAIAISPPHPEEDHDRVRHQAGIHQAEGAAHERDEQRRPARTCSSRREDRRRVEREGVAGRLGTAGRERSTTRTTSSCARPRTTTTTTSTTGASRGKVPRGVRPDSLNRIREPSRGSGGASAGQVESGSEPPTIPRRNHVRNRLRHRHRGRCRRTSCPSDWKVDIAAEGQRARASRSSLGVPHGRLGASTTTSKPRSSRARTASSSVDADAGYVRSLGSRERSPVAPRQSRVRVASAALPSHEKDSR